MPWGWPDRRDRGGRRRGDVAPNAGTPTVDRPHPGAGVGVKRFSFLSLCTPCSIPIQIGLDKS